VNKADVLIAGVGGQGIILCSDILGDAAIACGYDVKKTDTLGMAQRGGGVVSHIRIADKVWSPLIREGDVDLLLAFEKLEAVSWSHYLGPKSKAIVNNYSVPPLSVSLGGDKYPSNEEVSAIIKRRTSGIAFVEGTARSKELGDVRVVGLFMLGCASVFLPVKDGVWENVIVRRVPEKFRNLNLKAFEAGRKEISQWQLA